MIPVQRWLILAHDDSRLRHAAAEAVGTRFQVRIASDGTECASLLHTAPPGSLAIINDPAGGLSSTSSDGALLAALVDDHPTCGIVLATASSLDPVVASAYPELAEIILLASEATLAAIQTRLRLANARTVRRLEERLFGTSSSEREQRILDAAVETVFEGGHAARFAELLNIQPRTLPQRCDAASLPPPRRLLAWTRLLVAATLLEERWRTVTDVAALCGYANPNALRTAFYRMVGASPQELRARGALGVTSRAFRLERGSLV